MINKSMYHSGWRPMLGWIGVSGFAYEIIFRPVVNSLLVFAGLPPIIVGIEVNALNLLLVNILGIGTLRTVEKVKDVANK